MWQKQAMPKQAGGRADRRAWAGTSGSQAGRQAASACLRQKGTFRRGRCVHPHQEPAQSSMAMRAVVILAPAVG